MKSRLLLILLVLLLGCSPGRLSANGAPTASSSCRRTALEPQPTWASHGMWTDGGSTLVVADAGGGMLRLYDAEGRAVRTVARPGLGPLDFSRPHKFWELPDGYLLKDGHRFLWTDEDFVPLRSYDLGEVAVAAGGTVRTLFEVAVGGEHLFGIGDVLFPEESWRSGFISMRPGDATAHDILREIPIEERQEFDHYLMGDHHVAVLGDRGYFLAMDEQPFLLEAGNREEPRRLQAFPEGFRARPELPLLTGQAELEIRFLAYEKARIPVGLYGRGDRLFVLTREPIPGAEGGGTRWTLTRIDPEADEVEGAVVLPTRAAHLAVFPGPERWAMLEKGRVERYGVQPIPSMLLVPSAWIEGGPSPLSTGGPREELCEAP